MGYECQGKQGEESDIMYTLEELSPEISNIV
jgi:hypothetical protein